MNIVNELSSNKPLGREEMHELIKKAQAGCVESRNKVVEHSFGLVLKAFGNFELYDDIAEKDDIYSFAIEGLIRAIDDFNPKKGEFSTIAVFRMRSSVQRRLFEFRNTIKIPACEISKLSKAKAAFETSLPVNASDIPALNASNSISIEGIENIIVSRKQDKVIDSVFKKQLNEQLADELNALDDVTKAILKMRFGLFGEEKKKAGDCCKLVVLNGKKGITREWERVLLKRGIKKLKGSNKLRELAMHL
jgi:RNA polymerase sigma factor (sigma-70 family)